MFERYIFITLAQAAAPVPAGLFTFDGELGVGTYSYLWSKVYDAGRCHCDRSGQPPAFGQRVCHEKNNGIFSVLGDMFPDSWGKYILSQKLNFPFGALLVHEYFDLVTTNCVGALSVGSSPETITTPHTTWNRYGCALLAAELGPPCNFVESPL